MWYNSTKLRNREKVPKRYEEGSKMMMKTTTLNANQIAAMNRPNVKTFDNWDDIQKCISEYIDQIEPRNEKPSFFQRIFKRK